MTQTSQPGQTSQVPVARSTPLKKKDIAPTSQPRNRNHGGSVSPDLEIAAFRAQLEHAGYNRHRIGQYASAARCFLLWLGSRGTTLEDFAAAEWASYREHVSSSDPKRAGELLKGARAYLRMKAKAGALRPDQVPHGIHPHPTEAFTPQAAQEIEGWKANLPHTSSTASSYAVGARDLVLFLARHGKVPAEITVALFVAFQKETRRPDLKPGTAELRLHGARDFLRAKALRGELADKGLLPLIAPKDAHAVRAAYVAHDPREAERYREADAFRARRRAAGYRSHDVRGVLELLRFLGERPIGAITSEDLGAFHESVRGDHALLASAWAYLRMAAQDGRIRRGQLPRRTRAPKAPALTEGCVHHLRLLSEAMDACDLSPTTRPSYLRGVRDFLLWLDERDVASLAAVTRDILTAYRMHLKTCESTKGAPYSVRTQIGALVALRFFFSWLVKTGRLLIDPTIHLDTPRPPQTLPRVPRPGEIVHVLRRLPKTAFGIRDEALLELIYGTGMRRAEAARLMLDDVDLSARTIHIREGKGRKDRVVPVGRTAVLAMTRYLENVRPGLVRGDDPKAVFLGLGGRPITVSYLTQLVKRRGENAGLKIRPHLLRHACATHLLKGRADIRHIQRLLGHKSLQTTERYTRVEVSDLQDVIERCHPREKKGA